MKIRLIAVGGLKEPFYADAQKEYLKRLSPFASVGICELEPARVPKPGTPAQNAAALSDEGRRVLAKAAGCRLIALCVEGKKLDSRGFAQLIAKAGNDGCQTLAFAIGSSCGLSREVKEAAFTCVSFSDMTFPHHLISSG